MKLYKQLYDNKEKKKLLELHMKKDIIIIITLKNFFFVFTA